jgi:hypothetical protein
MSFNRLLAEAEPAHAAQAAMITAEALVDEPTVPAATRALSRRILEFSVEELTARIRSARQSAMTTPGAFRGDSE